MGRKRIPSAEGGTDQEAKDPIGSVAAAGKSQHRRGAGRPAKAAPAHKRRRGGIAVTERDGFGTSTAGYASADVSSASARVQSFPLRPPITKRPKSSAERKSEKSVTNSYGGSVHLLRSRSRSTNI